MTLNPTKCPYCGKHHRIGASYSCGGKMGELGIHNLVKDHKGIRLDIGCGANKQPGFIGMDKRQFPGVEIVWDWNEYPWPLLDETCLFVMASHVVEHVNPADGGFLRWMDELWRICLVGAEVAIATPHGSSQPYLQDPTHCNPCNEATWAYFAPAHSSGLYDIYQPKPWKLKYLSWQPTGMIEVVLVKEAEDDD